MAFVQNLGNNIVNASNPSISLAVPASGIPVGHTVLVAAYLGSAASTATASDSQGNTYSLDVLAFNSSYVAIFSGVITTALSSGDSITVTPDVSLGKMRITADEFDEALTLDQTATGTGSDAAPTTASTPTTTQAAETLYGAFSCNSLAGTFTPGTNFSSGGGVESQGRAIFSEYRSVASTGTYVADGTYADSATWAAAIATYYAAAGGTQHTGASSFTITPSITTVGSRTAYGSASDALTFSIATAGKRTAHGAVSFPITLGITTAGSGGHTEFGSASLALDLAISTAGKRTAHGTVDAPLTLSVATQGSRTAHGAVSLPISLGITTVGTLVNPVRFGSASFTITPTITTEGSRTAKGASSFDIAVGLTTRGRKHAYRSVTMPIALTITTGVTHSTKAEKRAQKRNELAWMKLARRDLFR